MPMSKEGKAKALNAARDGLSRAKIKRVGSYYENPKICKNNDCEEVISYEKRRNIYCSKNCSAKVNNIGIDRYRGKKGPQIEIQCLNCSIKIIDRKHWRTRKYCSNSCCNEYSYNKKVNLWLKGEIDGHHNDVNNSLAPWAKKYLLDTRGEKCESCNWAEVHPVTGKVPIQFDHIDGNSENSSPSNIKILCPNCHSLTPTFGALNKGNGRYRRHR